MKVRANGITINYELDGPVNAPVVTFSNSLFTNLTLWDDQVEALRESFRVLRYDQRGHGGTDAPPGRYSLELLAEDVLALLDALGVERTHFVGLSMGGTTGLTIASRQPARLVSVAVCDSRPSAPPSYVEEWGDRIRIAQEQGIEALAEITLRRWFHSDFVAAEAPGFQRVRDMMRTTPLAGYVGAASALQRYDLEATVDQLRIPTLFLAGERDGATPSILREAHQRVPSSVFVEIPGAGHISNIEQPDRFNQALNQFLLVDVPRLAGQASQPTAT